ncbi:MAG: BamA/TamA family outer membrane protein, partial [bacterium]
YGFRYTQKNFRGRAERFKASLWGGAQRGFKFKHVTPWIEGTPNFSQSIEIYQVTDISQNLAVKELELEARHTGASYLIGKRWNLELSSVVGGRFRLITAGNPAQLASAGQLDRVLDFQISNFWDRRDLKQFPRRGTFLGSGLKHGWVLNLEKSFTRFEIDARSYLPIAKTVSLCARSAWYPAWGEAPPYDWFLVKNTAPIRSTDISDEGRSFVLGSIEARIDLLTLHYFTWEKAPILKSYFRNLAYGLALEFFFDVGDAYDGFDELAVESLMWGYGFGFLVRLPYIDVLRLETSWNPEISPQNFSLSWKIGVSF